MKTLKEELITLLASRVKEKENLATLFSTTDTFDEEVLELMYYMSVLSMNYLKGHLEVVRSGKNQTLN